MGLVDLEGTPMHYTKTIQLCPFMMGQVWGHEDLRTAESECIAGIGTDCTELRGHNDGKVL